MGYFDSYGQAAPLGMPGYLPDWNAGQYGSPSRPPRDAYNYLNEYIDQVDALPLELTKSFGDLRELDAVLVHSANELHGKIKALLASIRDPSFDPRTRLGTLIELANDLRLFKPGSEDKVRVSSVASENIARHVEGLERLVDKFDDEEVIEEFGHTRGFYRTLRASLDGGVGEERAKARGQSASVSRYARRIQRLAGLDTTVHGTLTNGTAGGPKTKRLMTDNSHLAAVYPDYQVNQATLLLPHKSGLAAPSSGVGANAMVGSSAGSASGAGGPASGSRASESPVKKRKHISTKERERREAVEAATRIDDAIETFHQERQALTGHSHMLASGPAGMGSAPLSASSGAGGLKSKKLAAGAGLAGQSKPVVKKVRGGKQVGELDPSASASASAPEEYLEGGEPIEGQDEPRYCFCQQVSYGEMIACDYQDCELEWFHLGCVGLSHTPTGSWYCDNCRALSKRKKTKR